MKLQLLFIVFICHIGVYITNAQSVWPGDDKCMQLKTVIGDARNFFEKYKGEELNADYFLVYNDYTFSLWNDEGRELSTDDLNYSCVEFYYHTSHKLEEVKLFLDEMLKQVKDCMPATYFLSLSSGECDDSLVYCQFSDERDKENLENTTYPQIEVSIEENKDYYYVMITIIGPTADP